jgi:hypothetical protein
MKRPGISGPLYASLWFIVLMMVSSPVTGCARYGEAGSAHSGLQHSTDSGEGRVVVLFCSSIGPEQLDILLEKYRLSMRKRSSARIVTLGWQDHRTLQDVMDQLSVERVVCGIQGDHLYKAKEGD